MRTAPIAALLLALAQPLPAAPPDYGAAASEARAILSELIAADTSNPPGNESRAVAVGVKRLQEAGIPFEVTEFAPGRQNLVARLRGSGKDKPLLLLSHIDVVGASGQAWSTDPHRLTEAGGYLVGRGVLDDLGMAAVALETLLSIKRSGTPLKRDVILAWTGDEESDGLGVQYLLKNKPASIDAGLALNEGASILLDDSGKPSMATFQVAEKIYQDFEIIAKGPTGHSSVPQEGNAIYRLSAALERLGKFKFPVRLSPVTRAYLAARAAVEPPPVSSALRALGAGSGDLKDALAVVAANPSMDATLRTTCVATTISGGTRVNALPAEARANVNCRILPEESAGEVQAQLKEVLADPAVEVRPITEPHPAGASPLEGPGPNAIRAVVGRMWPGLPVIPVMEKGATDSLFLRAAGIPSYGIHPIPVAEAERRRTHGADERIPAGSLRLGVEFFSRLVLAIAG